MSLVMHDMNMPNIFYDSTITIVRIPILSTTGEKRDIIGEFSLKKGPNQLNDIKTLNHWLREFEGYKDCSKLFSINSYRATIFLETKDRLSVRIWPQCAIDFFYELGLYHLLWKYCKLSDIIDPKGKIPQYSIFNVDQSRLELPEDSKFVIKTNYIEQERSKEYDSGLLIEFKNVNVKYSNDDNNKVNI
jgi:hypothetical protein